MRRHNFLHGGATSRASGTVHVCSRPNDYDRVTPDVATTATTNPRLSPYLSHTARHFENRNGRYAVCRGYGTYPPPRVARYAAPVSVTSASSQRYLPISTQLRRSTRTTLLPRAFRISPAGERPRGQASVPNLTPHDVHHGTLGATWSNNRLFMGCLLLLCVCMCSKCTTLFALKVEYV